MHESFSALAGPGICAVGFAFLQQIALKDLCLILNKQTACPKGSLAGSLLAAFAGIELFVLFLLIFAKALTAVFLTLSLGVLLVCLNRAKLLVLHEPLVLVDAYLLPQVFRYPELYFPYLPVKALFACLGFGAMLLISFLWLEPSVSYVRQTKGIVLGLFIVSLPASGLYAMNRGKLAPACELMLKACPVSHDAVADAIFNGPLASALMHPLLAGQYRRVGKDFLTASDSRPCGANWPDFFENSVFVGALLPEKDLPHVIIIQAESFFDIRTKLSSTGRSILGDFLPNWDNLVGQGRVLPTPQNAFGAYTMRTEFRVLTGLGADALGPWAFNPYALASKRRMWSLARYFAQSGYSSFCIHPYFRNFFSRHKVMPNMGFETFISLEDLPALPRFGPHVSDFALGDEILSRLERADKPVFCFAISMEAHGPWLPRRLNPDQIEETLGDIEYKYFDTKLQMYLCHLRRMDQLFGRILTSNDITKNKGRSRYLWVYGDHAPALEPEHYKSHNALTTASKSAGCAHEA